MIPLELKNFSSDLLTILLNYALSYGLDFIGAVLILGIGWYAARMIKKIILKLMPEKHVDKTIATFVSEIAYYAILSIVLIAFLSKLGIQTTSLAAILGASALAIGYSLKNSISQLTSGMILVGTHPFKHGDTILLSANTQGVVKKVTLLYTILTSSDNQEIIIPNNEVLNGTIINLTRNKTRRINLNISVSYQTNIDLAKSLLNKLAQDNPRILKDPEPFMALQSFGDSSISLLFRVWVLTDDYNSVIFESNEQIKKIFDQNNISMPYPQREVRILN